MQLEFTDNRQWHYVFKIGDPGPRWVTIVAQPFGVKSYAATCPFQIKNGQVVRDKPFDAVLTWWEQYVSPETGDYLNKLLKLKAFW